VGGTIAAAIGLFINAYQVWRNRKAATLQHLLDFLKAMNEREAAIAANKLDGPKQLHAFIEFLNFLEIYSAAINARLLVGVAREIVQDKLLDCAVILENSPYWQDEIEKSKTSETTYRHTTLFTHNYRSVIAARKRAAAQ
jgi:hypothetical protein